MSARDTTHDSAKESKTIDFRIPTRFSWSWGDAGRSVRLLVQAVDTAASGLKPDPRPHKLELSLDLSPRTGPTARCILVANIVQAEPPKGATAKVASGTPSSGEPLRESEIEGAVYRMSLELSLRVVVGDAAACDARGEKVRRPRRVQLLVRGPLSPTKEGFQCLDSHELSSGDSGVHPQPEPGAQR